MADETIDQKLRAMAEHRGLKLAKSRKRKPGAGDYGKFGLTDAAGKPLLGIGADGLEVSAEDVETYLRAGTTSRWKESAESTPPRAAPQPGSLRGDSEEPETADAVIRPRGKRSASAKSETAKTAPTDRNRSVRKDKKPDPSAVELRKRATSDKAQPAAVTEPPSAPKLVIRSAKPADGAALVPLLRQLSGVKIDELGVVRNLKVALKAEAGMAVAELGEIVGCCGWAVIPTIQHGPVGRLTLLLVSEDHRRRGIATALLETAVTALRKAGCSRLEAMSDIEIRNAHNFFRTLKFEQTSYRFARRIEGV
jgi:N-acetylglutamate synthase-like GNAT family acetyltransferase